MSTHSLNSQTFRPHPVSLGAALHRLLAGWAGRRPPQPIEDRTEQSNRLRAYAESVRTQDPRFAADLFAAADRHESQIDH